MPTPFTELGPVVFANLTTAQRLALDQHPGLTVRDTDLGVLMQSDGAQWSQYITKVQLPDLFDAVVDVGYLGVLDTVYPTLAEAIAAGHISIFIRAAGDVDAVTIASTDNVQRIQGKDADTTELPVSVTCNKNDVTFEQLWLDTTTLSTSGVRRGILIQEILLKAAGAVVLGTGASTIGATIHRIRSLQSTLTPLTVQDTADELTISNSRFYSGTGTNYIAFGSAGSSGVMIIGNQLRNSVALGALSGYAIEATNRLIKPIIMGNSIELTAAGGINLRLDNGVILGNQFRVMQTLTAGKRVLVITTLAGIDIDTSVAFNHFLGSAAADVLFECAAADADADGLKLIGNTFRTGTVLGSQNAQWLGNDFNGCTINFQSKTGMVVIGGDMTGATLQNIPSDIVFRNVKGQDDRGHYLPVDATVDLGSATKRFRNAYHSGVSLAVQPSCRVYHSVAQSISDATTTVLAFDSERFDTDAIHDTVTNNSRLTCKTAGKYLIFANLSFAANATGIRDYHFLLSGATIIAYTTLSAVGSGISAIVHVTTVYDLAVNDYVQVRVRQTSGGALDLRASPNYSPEFGMVYLGT